MAKVAEETLRVEQAENIDQVLAQLSAIIEWSTARKSRLGYFPALYRKVTLQVQKGISEVSSMTEIEWNASTSSLPTTT